MPRRASLPIIFLTIFLDLLGFGIVIPLLPLLARELGASGFEAGLLLSAYSAAQLICAPLWGRLSDRIGRRPVLLISIAANVLALLLFASAHSVVVLLLARIFAGVATSNIGTAQAYIADITPPDQRARGMGLLGAAFGLGFVFGPAIGGLLSIYGWAAPPLAAAALSALNLLLAFFLLPESLHPDDRAKARARRGSRLAVFRTALNHPLLPTLFAIFFLVTVGFSQLETTFTLFTSSRFQYGMRENGYLFAFIGILLAFVQGGLVHPLRKWLGEPVLLVVGTVLLTVGLFALVQVDSLAGLLFACGILAVGHGLESPALTSLISKQTTSHEQGQVLGVSQSMGTLGRIVGPFLGGLAFDHGGDTAAFLTAAGIVMLAVALGLLVQRRAAALQPAM